MRTFISVQCDKLKHLSNDYNVKVETYFGGIKITKVAGFFIIKEKRLIIRYVNYVKTIHFWGFFNSNICKYILVSIKLSF